jgi:hypothetical protein
VTVRVSFAQPATGKFALNSIERKSLGVKVKFAVEKTSAVMIGVGEPTKVAVESQVPPAMSKEIGNSVEEENIMKCQRGREGRE